MAWRNATLRRGADRAGCHQFFAPSTQSRSVFTPTAAPFRVGVWGGAMRCHEMSLQRGGVRQEFSRSPRPNPDRQGGDISKKLKALSPCLTTLPLFNTP
jgi:hypothetical protein